MRTTQTSGRTQRGQDHRCRKAVRKGLSLGSFLRRYLRDHRIRGHSVLFPLSQRKIESIRLHRRCTAHPSSFVHGLRIFTPHPNHASTAPHSFGSLPSTPVSLSRSFLGPLPFLRQLNHSCHHNTIIGFIPQVLRFFLVLGSDGPTRSF